MVTEATIAPRRIDPDEAISEVQIVWTPNDWRPTDPLQFPPDGCQVLETNPGEINYIRQFNSAAMDHGGQAWAVPVPKGTPIAVLHALTNHAIQITFEPRTHLTEDPDSKGHLYSGTLAYRDYENDADCITLDDRKPEPLGQQLVDELKRIAAFYADLAETAGANYTPEPVTAVA